MAVNNEELVKYLMTHSPHGLLVQIFILEAIAAYAERVIDMGDPGGHGTGLISKLAWYEIAKDVKFKIENRGEIPGSRIKLITEG